MVYSRQINGTTYSFGVSGRLYKSNVLLYDHQTDSLWSQLSAKAIAGPMAGTPLSILPALRTTWRSWKAAHPETLILSTDTGHRRDYTKDPYEGYYRVGTIWFPVGEVRKDLSPKERVIGIELHESARAYSLEQLRVRAGTHEDRIGNTLIRIQVGPGGEIVSITDQDGQTVPHIYAYWFAWQAFHPETSVYGR